MSSFTDIYNSSAGISISKSIYNELGQYKFRRNLETTWLLRKQMDGNMFLSRQSRLNPFVNVIMKTFC